MDENTTNFIVGKAPNNKSKQKRGMDEIDKWAEQLGKADKALSAMRPKRRHLAFIH